MSDEKTTNLRREIKDFINTTHFLIHKIQSDNSEVLEKDLTCFAEKIWQLNHFSIELLNSKNLDESLLYNARILKDLTESPIYHTPESKQGCSLVNAADYLIKEKEFSKIKTIMGNLISNESASEVLFDDLMVIYKELAA